MSVKLGSAICIQTQMAVSVFNRSYNGEYHGSPTGKPAGTRRVFVQTETGCVLGMELDRNDNAHTVKRRLQLALNVPTDGSSLTLGDLTLNNDLRVIRKDSPLLLTRNTMHRSSSSPCLSPTGRNHQQKDQSGPIEILVHSGQFDRVNELVNDIVTAMKNDIDPIPAHGGLGGAYYFRNSRGEKAAIVKPTDEEPFAPNNPKGFVGKALGYPGLKPSVRVGETGFREVAAYLLDHDHFANVPPTVLVKVTHSIFNVNVGVDGNKVRNGKKVSKIASLQQYMPHDFDASDHGTSSFPVAAVHRIGILDIRIFNTDRHAGNLLVRKLDAVGGFGQVELIPIDHGLCLPESLEDPYFEWIHWPQASIPFSKEELEYIKELDPVRDSEMLRAELPMIREACLRVLVLCTIFLQEAARSELCLAEIGEMMSRDFCGGEEEPSELEALCLEAWRIVTDGNVSETEGETDEGYQFYIDYENANVSFASSASDNFSSTRLFKNGSGSLGDLCLPVKLAEVEESLEEDEVELESLEEDHVKVDEELNGGSRSTSQPKFDWFRTASKLSLSLKKLYLGDSSRNCGIQKADTGHMTDFSSGSRRSANEQQAVTTTYVRLADMNEEEWTLFLEKFKEVLPPAFETRRKRQRTKLGTSCQF